ncbi:MAG TPA: condensation domain-containing protein, partial [Thermoanaerobaculia bacterium]|nr:condensation domain-containing protein [Thermoanaerobaculia bacterium]
DTSAEEIWPCLTRGGTLVLRDDRALGGPAALAAALHEWRTEVLDLPTAFWHELAPALAAGELALPPSVRLVIIGGEKALGERLADWRRGLGARAVEVRLLNTYGPTETTIVAAAAPLADEAGPGDPPIGRPVAGARIVVLDPGHDPAAPGVAGEVLIGGAGVSRGYLGRPRLTAERFVPDPFADGALVPEGARLYRTGDAAAWAADGRLEFRGRLDGQLKIRGYRVEPGEVESALATHPAVLEAAVVPWQPEGVSETRLAAYAVPRPGAPAPDAEALRAHLEERLPAYMVPSALALLPELPRTASGKLDREALPKPEAAAAAGRRAALRTPMEELLAGWWCELLGLDRVGRDDDFFRLGGHSLLVGRLAARVRKELGVDLPLIDVFEHPTLAALAERVAGLEGGPGGAELPPLVPTDRSRPLPLSYQQERVWFLQNLVPGTVAYNFQLRMRLLGRLDVASLERALTEVVRRHEVLRTTFPEIDGEPRQVVQAPWRVRLPVIDLRRVAPTAADGGMDDAAALAALAQAVSVPFDVTGLPLIRWQLLRLDDEHHQLVQVEHHFVHDGWSVAILLGELDALYSAFTAGEGSPLPELAVQYGDFAAWQRGWMEGEAMERLLGYWRRKLDGAPTRLDLPADRPRPPRTSLRGDAVRELLPAGLYRELRAFGRREGFTLFMTMMAAFQALLGRYTAGTDFLVGMGTANRRVAELEPIVGMMVNSLVARADLGGDPTFRELLERARRTTLEAYAHQDMPFERLVGELQPERDASRNPLFQAMFSFHDAAVPDLRFGGLEAGFLVEHNRSAKTDLNVIVAPRAEQRVGRASAAVDERAVVTWEFSTDLFDRSRIERLIRHYYTLTAAALANPDLKLSELPLLDPAEEARVLDEWSGRESGYPRKAGLPELFARQAAARPDEPAVTFCGESLSYRQLDRLSAAMARRLAEAG